MMSSQLRRQSNLPWILGGVAAFLVCLCGVGGFAGWRLFQRFRGPVPAHAGFHRGLASRQLDDGWYALTFKDIGFSMEMPAALAPNYRRISPIRAPWITSYESFHGRSRSDILIVGGLW